MAGKVINRAGLELPRSHYDYLVLGGGLLGLTCAFYLRMFSPDASLLVVEQDGIPSETGATHVSPGIVASFFEEDRQRRAIWTRDVLVRLEELSGVTRYTHPFTPSGVLRLLSEARAGAVPAERLLEQLPGSQARAVRELVDLERTPFALFGAQGGYANAEAVTLTFGHGALKRGADLLLNARASPAGERIRLERLEFDRHMARIVVRTEMLTADRIIVALGAATPSFVEEALGSLLPYRRVYRQYLRVEADARLPLDGGRVRLPVVQARGFSLRPQGEGLLIVPPPLPADPEGYQPQGAKLMGVGVGVRREIIDQLIASGPELPVLSWESLNLGKTVRKVRGAWETVTPMGIPEWRQVGDAEWYALVGGEHAMSLGPRAAFDLASFLSGNR